MVAREPVGGLDQRPCVRQRVERCRLQQEVGHPVEVLTVEHLLALSHRLDRVGAGGRVGEPEQRLGELVADALVVLGRDDPVGLAPAQRHGDALAGRDDARVGAGRRPVGCGRGHGDLAVQPELVVGDARDRPQPAPREQAHEARAARHLEVAELLQHPVHVERARDRLVAVVGHDHDDVVGAGALDQRPEL